MAPTLAGTAGHARGLWAHNPSALARASVQRFAARMALLLLCVAQFLLILDVAIVNVALPPIGADLGFAPRALPLVVTAYALAFGALLLLGGRLADVLGRRRLFVAGLVLFIAASVACGLARTPGALVAARAVQGVGGALVSPAALALLTALFPEGPARDRALGTWSALAAAGGATGLLLGGVLTELAGWRWVFLVNVVGLPVALLARWVLPADRPEGGRVDVPGALTVTVGLLALVAGLTRGGEEGFDGTAVALVVAGVVLLAAFVALEAWTPQPLLPLGLFRSRTVTGANLATLLLAPVVIGVNVVLTLHLQQVLGYPPLRTGLAFLPLTVVGAATSIVAARLVGRAGARALLVGGLVAMAAGTLLLARLPADGGYLVDVLPGLVLVAVGMGPGFTVGTLAATAGVADDRRGAASGVLSTSQQIGGAVGLAVLTVVAAAAGDGLPGSQAAFLAMAGFALAGAAVAAALIRPTDARAEHRRAPLVPAPVPAAVAASTAPCQPAALRAATVPVEGAP